MNAERLLALYDHIAEAPDAIARLRRFVLDLAVRGKLVEQNAADEPASELLKRIAKEKARLVRAGGIKPERQRKESASPVARFSLPAGWAWTDLQAVCISIADGDHLPPPKAEKGVPFLVISDVRNKIINYSPERYVPRDYYEALDPIRRPTRGDLLYTLVGSFGIPVEVVDDGEFCVQRHIGILRPSRWIDVSFLARIMESEFVFRQANACATGIAQKTLPLSGLRILAIALPPLAEQHRIVAKVDELMALCDRLEAARAARETTRDRLTAASLARLTTPAADEQVFRTHARFALGALPALTTRPDQIKTLRQAILNLAVRGKLVPQDPADEPASELLRQITKEIPAAGGIEEIKEVWPFDIPRNWSWTQLGRLIARSDAGWSPRTLDHPRSGSKWGVLKVSAVSWGKFRAWENKQLLPGTEPRLQAAVRQGDFLISRANTADLIARAVIVEDEPINLMMSDKIVRLHLSRLCNHRFVWLVNNYADYSRAHYVRHASGVSPSMKNVSREVILSLPIPLPPLAEQHRIVAKMDELMALCDRLEASLNTVDTSRLRLLEALLHEALLPAAKTLEAAE